MPSLVRQVLGYVNAELQRWDVRFTVYKRKVEEVLFASTFRKEKPVLRCQTLENGFSATEAVQYLQPDWLLNEGRTKEQPSLWTIPQSSIVESYAVSLRMYVQ